MATVKIKFRPSTVDGGQGTIFYQVIHNRVARQQKTGYRLYGYEWNSHLTEVVLPRFNDERKRYLSEISDKIVSIRPRACFFPLFSFLPLWLHYNLNPLCVQY